jgi:hypothetical protein
LSDQNDDTAPKSATQTLAELVARRKAAQGAGANAGPGGRRQSERAAAARSASKSKPAMRK